MSSSVLPTTSSLGTSTSTSTSPFFPDPTTLTRPQESPDIDHRKDLAKLVLEWLFLVIMLLVISGLVTYRFNRLRQANRPLSQFFQIRRSETMSSTAPEPYQRRSGMPYSSTSAGLAYYPYLTPVAPTYHHAHSRRTNASDVDSGGRRLGGGGDHDNISDKDILPPYDHTGGPPKYVDLEAQVGRPMFIGFGVTQSRLPTPNTTQAEHHATSLQLESTSEASTHQSTAQPAIPAPDYIQQERPLPLNPPSSPQATSPPLPATPLRHENSVN